MNNKTHKIVFSAMMASLACVVTMIVKIPSPFKGYLNLGDCVALLCGWVLGPMYAFFSAGLGSAMADIFSGYALYAPATFIIKGAMALAAFFFYGLLKENVKKAAARIISGALSEIIMVLGYFVFEGILYGFAPSAVNIPANTAQGVIGLIAALLLARVFEKAKI